MGHLQPKFTSYSLVVISANRITFLLSNMRRVWGGGEGGGGLLAGSNFSFNCTQLMRPMSGIQNVFQYSFVVVALLLYSPVC